MQIIKEYLKNERLSEKNIAKTYNELQKFSQKDRKLAVAYLKGKIADYDIRHDLLTLVGWIVTIVASILFNKYIIEGYTWLIIVVLVAFGLICITFSESARKCKLLLALIEQTLN